MVLKVYKYANILSIDVVAGACASTLCIADFLNLHLTVPVLVCLSAAVFVIYTADHLMDARRVKHAAHTPRHLFHQQHFRVLLAAIVVLTLAGLVFMLRLPLRTIWYGGILGVVVGIYFLSIRLWRRRWLYHKEFLVAFIYTAGIFLGPASLAPPGLPPAFFVLFFQFFLLALINVLVFSCYEMETDKKDGHISFARNAGLTLTRKVLWILLSLGAMSLVFVQVSWGKILAFQPVIAAMFLTLFLITAFPSYFRRGDRYRLWGDAIFLYPALYLIF